MIKKILHSLLGSANDRYLKAIQPLVLKINSYEESLQALSDDALKGKTAEFKERLKNGESSDDLLAEAFAVVREASVRTLGMRHFDVQLLGGIVLHKGHISEMKTGEGKTLVATLVAYLNALEGKGVHLVTVNEYLARRDAEWMGKIYNFLGLSVGVIFPDLDPMERQQAYLADVTYGTNNEFGFDYLRDNLKMSREQMAMRDFNFAIIDEVDSILIDEARTPLIISGPTETLSKNYVAVDKLIPLLSSDDFELDEKARSISLTDAGSDTIEKLLQDNTDLLQDGGLYDVQNISILHHIDQALRSHHLFKRDKDYVVKDNQIVIIDEFTGRLMKGRRYSDGLHQAIEAKENVPVQTENQTLASVTFQNYFRMYPKLSGMTGTAMTEAEEFEEIYSLPVIAIPTNKEMQRIDNDDEVYRTSRERDQAFLQDLKICYAKKQPVLVGTISIDRSEELSKFLKKEKIPHKVLNANQDASEAEIIAEAGAPGAITIATNMAGRGTDIQLGGNLDSRLEKALKGAGDAQKKEKIIAKVTAQYEKDKADVLAAGGLYVLGTERHESRRIDNQLRGRSGRQGDPGATKFYVSLEDDLMRIFGSERIEKILTTLGLEEGEAIIHPWISKALEKAQQKVEGRNFEIRKQLLKYDDVMNDQRKVIFSQRIELMDSDNVNETVIEMREEVIEELIERTIPDGTMPDQWQLDTLHTDSMRLFAMDLPVKKWAEEEGIGQEEIKARLYDTVNEHMQKKREQYGDDLMNRAEKSLVLQILDHHWKEHLLQLDHLRASVGLRAYAQRDPLNEYKQESFSLFEGLLWKMNETVTQVLSHLQISTDAFTKPAREKQKQSENLREGRVLQSAPFDENDPATWGKTARNSPCPCKSGKKYKHCHGKL